jgi:hypothetical protein
MEHLARALAREAHGGTVLPGHGGANMDDTVAGAERSQRRRPPPTHPGRGDSDIGFPQWIPSRNPGIDPQVITRSEEDGAPTPSTSNNLRTQLRGPLRIDDLGTLGTAEHQRRMMHASHQGVSGVENPELLYPEQ